MMFCERSAARTAFAVALTLALLLATLPVPSVAARGTVSVMYEPSGPEDADVVQIITENHIGDEVARIVNDLNVLPSDVIIRFGTEEGPQYAPAVNGPAEIHFPYAFVRELRRIFAQNGYASGLESLDQATLDVVQHTLFHELGHAIIDMLHIDTGDGEEDAVDSLAAILLIESFDNGGDIALNAADAFSFLASDEDDAQAKGQNRTSRSATTHSPSPGLAAALDEHSLNEHRYEAIACIIYGSNPDRYEFIARDLQLSDQDAANCVDNYTRQAEYWFSHFQQ